MSTSASQALVQAVAARFAAVNGDHPMSAQDDAYVRGWMVSVEELADTEQIHVDELRGLMLASKIPLPSYICSDGTQMVPKDLLAPLKEAGGAERLVEWFACQWENPTDAVQAWSDYLSGQYVCLWSVTPKNMRRKSELVQALREELAKEPRDEVRLNALADEFDQVVPPFAAYDRLRFGGPLSRDELITPIRSKQTADPSAESHSAARRLTPA